MSEISQKQIEEANQTREALRIAFEQFYSNLAGFLQRLNIEPTMKSYCAMNFDQGAFWAREGINAMFKTFQAPSQGSQSNQPEGDKKEEEVKENSEPKQEEKPQE